jgi:hypothetical protein
MNSKATSVLLFVLVLVAFYNAYTLSHLEDSVKQLDWKVNNIRPTPQVDLSSVEHNTVSAMRELIYLELLSEGMTRKMGLPIDKAKQAFATHFQGLPPNWKWDAVWEGEAPPKTEAPAPAKPAQAPARAPQAPRTNPDKSGDGLSKPPF